MNTNNLTKNASKQVIFERIQAVADFLPTPFYCLDLDFRCRVINEITLEVIGFIDDIESAFNKSIYDVYPEEIADKLADNQRKVTLTGQRLVTNETIVDITTGKTKYFAITISPLYDDENTIIGTYNVSFDITAEHEAKELTVSNLQKEKQLLLKSIQAQENNKIQLSLRKNFIIEAVSGIAHELNQPLAAISNYVSGIKTRLQSLYGDDLPQDIQAALQNCKLQAKRTGDIIHSFKDLLSKGDITKKPCNINELITSHCVLLTDLLNKDNIVLDYQPDEMLPVISCDKTQITQIIHNFIMNAKDAILSSNAINKTILITTIKHSDSAILISIEDFACGIDPDIIDKIFLPFFTTKDSATGIGLSLSYTIAQKHSGHLSVESIQGRGAKFNLILPF